MKLFQNKFFIICLCIAVVLCAVPTTFAIMGYRGISKNILGTLTAPFRWCVTAVENAAEGFGKYFSSIDALSKENEKLKEEKESLENDLERMELLEAENARLREYLEMKKIYPSFEMEEGMIISYASDNVSKSFTVNRGTLHGIDVNMPVVVKNGIVGYVTDVGLNWCTVTTILEADSSVGGYIPRSGASGIVSGDYALWQNGCCKISYLGADSDVQVGDKIYSTGTGSIYPSELLIGEVVEITVDEYSREKSAIVKSTVDFEKLSHVLIITDYED